MYRAVVDVVAAALGIAGGPRRLGERALAQNRFVLDEWWAVDLVLLEKDYGGECSLETGRVRCRPRCPLVERGGVTLNLAAPVANQPFADPKSSSVDAAPCV